MDSACEVMPLVSYPGGCVGCRHGCHSCTADAGTQGPSQPSGVSEMQTSCCKCGRRRLSGTRAWKEGSGLSSSPGTSNMPHRSQRFNENLGPDGGKQGVNPSQAAEPAPPGVSLGHTVWVSVSWRDTQQGQNIFCQLWARECDQVVEHICA